jgi:hypothetical protein
VARSLANRPLPIIPTRGSSFKRLRRTSTGLFRSASTRDRITPSSQPQNGLPSRHTQRLTSKNLNTHGRRRADSLNDPVTQISTSKVMHKSSTDLSDISGVTVDQSSTFSVPIMIHADDIPTQAIGSYEPATEPSSFLVFKTNDGSATVLEKELPAVPASAATESITSNGNVSPDSKIQKRSLRSSLNVFTKKVRGLKKEKEVAEAVWMSKSSKD